MNVKAIASHYGQGFSSSVQNGVRALPFVLTVYVVLQKLSGPSQTSKASSPAIVLSGSRSKNKSHSHTTWNKFVAVACGAFVAHCVFKSPPQALSRSQIISMTFTSCVFLGIGTQLKNELGTACAKSVFWIAFVGVGMDIAKRLYSLASSRFSRG